MVKTTKDQRLFENLLRVAKQFVSGKGYTPLTAAELKDRLHIAPQHEKIFRSVLKQLISEGVVQHIDNRYACESSKTNTVSGIMRMHPRGFGFLHPDDCVQNPQDVFVPKHLTQNAVDGDRVEVLLADGPASDKGPEGRVSAILERSRTHIAGIIRSADAESDIIAYVPLLGQSQRVLVEQGDSDLKTGDRVVMEVLRWGSKETQTVCRASHIIGHIDDPSTDIAAAIEEFEIRAAFPKRVIDEAVRLGSRVAPTALKNRTDLRELTCVTIDPETAKDFDDALSLSKDDQGNYHLGVHIADVSYYVQPGTALDDEARLRCNSTYFPGTCVPMLPSELSDNLCSLKANVNRLTGTVFMTFDSEGTLRDYKIHRSVIKSARRFSYSEAKEVLDGVKKSPHEPLLELMVELCLLLKRQRFQRGSIEFALPDLVVIVDPEGTPQGTQVVQYDITHQMVEEFMLKANEIVAWHLTKSGSGLTYRVHEQPAEENLREFAALAAAFGFDISDKPQPSELQALFQSALTTPYGPYLAASYIRSMRLAIYSPENIGHYGLSLEHYCHFTSPIRRYVDLVVHRILFADSHPDTDLVAISSRCSEQERLSAKAENNVLLLKKLRLLKANYLEEPLRQYEAVVTRVKPFGISFEILELMIEGFLHISELDNDYFIYDEKCKCLIGRHTKASYRSGDRIFVILKAIDLVLLESVWYLAPGSEPEHQVKKNEVLRSANRKRDNSDRKRSPRRTKKNKK